MRKIANGTLFEGTRQDGAYQVHTFEANGVREVLVRPVIRWEDIGPAPRQFTREEYLAQFLDEPEKHAQRVKEFEEEDAERAARCLRKSAQRAKRECRRTIIAEGFDELATLSYRENMQDRDLTKKHFKEWVRRMRVVVPGFRYCAAPEPQERGAYHWHAAIHRLPKVVTYRGKTMEGWRVGTAIWRAIVGKDNGLCFIGGKSQNGWPKPRMILAKLAAYVSKYILKGFEDQPPGSNRYSRSTGQPDGQAKPAKVVEFFFGTTMHDLIVQLWDTTDGVHRVANRLSPDFGLYWQVTQCPS